MNFNIGNLIKEKRQENNWSQQELADKIPTDRSNISRWENESVQIPLDKIKRLCEIFSLDLAELLTGETRNENNKQLHNNVIIDIMQNQNNKVKKFKICLFSSLLIIFLLIFMFLIYYFNQTYNSIYVYKIIGSSNNYEINDGLLIITREDAYFKIGSINDKSMDIELYLKDNNKDILIYNGNSNNILVDYYGYKQYFDIKMFKKNIDKYYLKIENEIVNLSFIKQYNNSNYIMNEDESVNESVFISENTSIPDKIKKEFKCNETNCELNLDNYIYNYNIETTDLSIVKDDIYVLYNNKLNTFYYTSDTFSFSVNNGEMICNKDCEKKNKIYNEFNSKIKKYFS